MRHFRKFVLLLYHTFVSGHGDPIVFDVDLDFVPHVAVGVDVDEQVLLACGGLDCADLVFEPACVRGVDVVVSHLRSPLG